MALDPLATDAHNLTPQLTRHPGETNTANARVNVVAEALPNVEHGDFEQLRTGNDWTASFEALRDYVGAGGRFAAGRRTYELDGFVLPTKTALVGGGVGATVLKAKSGAARVLTIDGGYDCALEHLSIDGNSRASVGLRIKGMNLIGGGGGSTSQKHMLKHVNVEHCSDGVSVEGADSNSQADKNQYLGVAIRDCARGLYVATGNGQQQAFFGGSIDDCDVAVELYNGTFAMYSGQMQSTAGGISGLGYGTMFKFTGPGADSVHLVDVITEGWLDAFDCTVANAWPLNGVVVDHSIIEAYDNLAVIDRGGSVVGLRARDSRLHRGEINLRGNDTFFYSDRTTLETGATVVHNGVNTKHYETNPTVHEIGAASEPAFENSWGNIGSGNSTAAFWMDASGTVHLKGVISGGTVGAAAFTLPVGYRPALVSILAAISNGAVARVDVNSAGVVTIQAGSNVYVSLDGLSFKAA